MSEFGPKMVEKLLEAITHTDEANYEGICIDQVTGESEPAQGYTSPAGLVMRSHSGRTVLIPPQTALELLDSVTAITMTTILHDFLTQEVEDEERAHMAQALFDAVERLVQTKTHLGLTFESPMVVAGAYMRARAKHYAEHVHDDENEEDE